MITVEDKIRTFSKYVYEKEVNLSDKLITETSEKNAAALEESRKNIVARCSAQRDRMEKRIFLDTQKIISKAKMEARNGLLDKRNEIFRSFQEEVRMGLQTFTQSSEYDRYMENLFQQASSYLESSEYSICMTERDTLKFSDKLKHAYPSLEIQTIGDNHIGGIMLALKTGKERIDMTLLRKFDESKRDMGILLFEALEKQVIEVE